MILCVQGGDMEPTLEELNETEAELLEAVSKQDYPERLRERASNLIKQRFRLERAVLWIKQMLERGK